MHLGFIHQVGVSQLPEGPSQLGEGQEIVGVDPQARDSASAASARRCSAKSTIPRLMCPGTN